MKIKLKAYDGVNFVCAENGGGQELVANRTSPREWETFDILGNFVFGGSISLKTYNGIHFVCAEDGGGKGLIANRTEAHQWETFKVIGPNGKIDGSPVSNGDKISLQTYDNKHFVCAESGGGQGLVANRTEAREWETFTVQFASITLKTYDGTYFVCADNGGGQKLVANRTEAREWETFDVLGEFVFGGNISLRTYDKIHFVCAENGGGGELIASKILADIWETFKIIGPSGKTDGSLVQNGDKISFQTYNNKHFICAEGGGGQELVANRTEAHEWETFTVQYITSSATPTRSMKIIHISDTHFTDFSSSVNKIETIISSLLNIKKLWGEEYPKVIVITGDLTDSGDDEDYLTAREFILRLQESGFDVYAIPGNHDYCKLGWLKSLTEFGSRREKFINYIYSTTHQSSQYPQVINLGSCKLILLDSMQAEMDEDTGDNFAQGKLGELQLSKLKRLLADYEAERKTGTKIVMSLHHHPFKPEAADSGTNRGGLNDAQQFMEIIANKIDCLLFGHSTIETYICQQCQQFLFDEATMYGIPIINDENLENMDLSTGRISVIDLAANIIKVYSTDNSQPPQLILGKTLTGIHITPVVSRSSAVYNYLDLAPSVKFQSGDIVNITIGGGVQTGGHGSTWKRYVNPSGSDSDKFYFGKIYIPGITSGLVPIRSLVPIYGSYDTANPDKCTMKFTIPNIDNIPESSRYLSLGYPDDTYRDNGFWGHDDGTEDQCKNVGPAYIDIGIQHQQIIPQIPLQYNILSPIVNSNVPIIYNGSSGRPAIAFQQGDKVTVVAGGGVQTGGHGKTWKRYVNPSGSDSNKFYFGKIYIPGITSSLTAIRDLVSMYGSYDSNSPDKCTLRFTVPNIDALPASNRYFITHYLDDDYSDDGYWGHDDGTEDQCKNVGNAFINITIER